MTFLTAKKGIVLVLVASLLVGGALRLVDFHDLLRFELDQARDARVVDAGLRGDIFDLPLLGPRAGGTYLRLPPAFYHFEYLSALVFGRTPTGMALFIPILSILSIPLFYWFARRYLRVGVSLSLTGIFSVSTYLVLYGRFAWNPNPLPFFLLLGFLALLFAVEEGRRFRGWWFMLSVAAFSIATQLHFLAFISIPLIVAAFLIYRRPRFSWKVWLSSLAVLLVLYLPVVLNEVETGWRNSQEFVKAVSGKSGKGDHPLVNKIVKNLLEQAMGAVVVVTGYEKAELPRFKTQPTLQVICDADCQHGLPAGLVSLVLLGASVWFLVWRMWRTPAGSRRDFLVLIGLWYGAVLAVLVPIAFSYSPRFFLLMAPIPFILLGFLAEVVLDRCGERKWLAGILVALALLLVASNLFFTTERLSALARGVTEPVVIDGPDRILKDKARVSLALQEQLIAYMEERSRTTGYPIYMFSEPQHRRALKYLLERRGLDNAVMGFDGIYREGVYFIILRTHSDLEDGTRKYRTQYEEIDRREFGVLTLIEFRPKAELDIPLRQDFSRGAVKGEDARWAPRYTWREWWNRQEAMTEEDESLDGE